MTITPIPFNPYDYPNWWPPVERQLAAGLGVATMSLLRRFTAERDAGVDTAAKFASARIADAVAAGEITAADAALLYPFLSTTRDADALTAAQAFQTAYDDPDSSPFTLATLSLLKEHSEMASTEDDITVSEGELVALVALGTVPGFALGFAAGVAGAYVYEHLHVSWR
jgi:hypothetical protein